MMYVLYRFDFDEVDAEIIAVSEDFDRLKEAAQERVDQVNDMLEVEYQPLEWEDGQGYFRAKTVPESSIEEEYRIEEGFKL